MDCWVGKDGCYNIRKDAECPIFPGEHRSEEVKKKISLAQKGKPRWTEEHKKQMSIDRRGRKHSLETIKKFKLRKSSFENIKKAQQFNVGKTYSNEHCWNITLGKLKNKISSTEYETIKSLYLTGMNQRQISIKYNINEHITCKILKKLGVK